MRSRPVIIALDLEGTLAPELWIEVSRESGISELRTTTRDIPDFAYLMKMRIETLKKHGITYPELEKIVEKVEPFKGAGAFLEWIRGHRGVQPVILSDTFYELATPVVRKLGSPLILCNTLHVNERGEIASYRMRKVCGGTKGDTVKAFEELGFSVFAMGDSYNDIPMLTAAEGGTLFHAPEKIKQEYLDIPTSETYEEAEAAIERFLGPVSC